MLETFGNGGTTLLSSGINDSQTTLSVNSTAGFPDTGNFRIVIDTELMLVTNVTGSTFTVERGIEGTTAASHTSDTQVHQVLTAGGLERLGRDCYPLFREPSRALNRLVDGSGDPLDAGDFAWINQEGSTRTTLPCGAWNFTFSQSVISGIRVFQKVAPSTPYVIKTAFVPVSFEHNEGVTTGVHFSETSSGSYLCCYFDRLNRLIVQSRTNENTIGTNYIVTTWPFNNFHVWVWLEDDGTDLIIKISNDGILWQTVRTEARGSFFTTGPDRVGVSSNPVQAIPEPKMILTTWEES